MAFHRWVTSRKVWRAQRNKPLVLAGMAAWDGAMRRVRTVERRERWQGTQASYRAIAVRWRRAERVLSRYDASVRGALVQAWADSHGARTPNRLLALVHAYDNGRLCLPPGEVRKKMT